MNYSLTLVMDLSSLIVNLVVASKFSVSSDRDNNFDGSEQFGKD